MASAADGYRERLTEVEDLITALRHRLGDDGDHLAGTTDDPTWADVGSLVRVRDLVAEALAHLNPTT